MASIVRRKNRYLVVYYYQDLHGNKKQKWETYHTKEEAKKRKAQVEYEKYKGIFVAPSTVTVAELLEKYVEIYGIKKWSLSTYNSRRALMNNYIIPLIGDRKLNTISPRVIDEYYRDLLLVESKSVNNRKPKSKYLTQNRVIDIHKLLNCAFGQAVKWELMNRNPVMNAILPEPGYEKRNIWTEDILMYAIGVCEDELLSLALNIAFVGTLRIGEMLALTWNCIDISDEAIKSDCAYMYIDKTLQRASKNSIEALDGKDILKIFPSKAASKTTLLLKKPKTKMSVRKIYLPFSAAQMLLKRKQQIIKMKELLGDEYQDNNLVFCHSDGRPMESQVINDAMAKLIRKHNLPYVVFHSIRHTSVTYKLKWNNGDIKSVQGDSGHSRAEMIANVYSHILDEDRKVNAQKLEEQFYKRKEVQPAEKVHIVKDIAEESKTWEFIKLVNKASNNPELLKIIRILINNFETNDYMP